MPEAHDGALRGSSRQICLKALRLSHFGSNTTPGESRRYHRSPILADDAHTGFVAVGDLNGDGIPDLAVANNSNDYVSVLLGTGTGSFGTVTNFAVGAIPNSIAIGDLNGDGKLDLAVANYGSGSVSILLNNSK